ncbi:hypothetical protein, conserved [Eimeria acervulina]|uniref:Uncharacterized protein n=1 Tax=Eimeria acervulina TaxID=5801 RepID=U6GFM5_EIMAC|nr:hypothetical protein, conserved [Eimeria acervulina]CDI78377.1 hypothetical protein, conserved [Eimeria acervulina]
MQVYKPCGAWQEAADMYRKEGEWIEAERVAAAGGGAAAARRMQLLHARETLKTDSPEAAVQMLLKRGENAAAVELALEAEAFALAAYTAEQHCSEKLAEVYVQLGRHKEAAGQLHEAEEAYLKAHFPAAAVALYRKRGKLEEALRVARLNLPSEVQQLLLQQAKAKVAAEDLQGAEAALLEAGREDVAVQLLLRKGKFAAAVRLCGRRAPQLLQQVLQQLQQQQQQFKSMNELSDICSALEEAGAIEESVAFCLSADSLPPADPQTLRSFWLHAVELAKGLGDPLHAAAAARAAAELQQLGDRKAAGDMLLAAGKKKEALKCYVAAEAWAAAKELGAALGTAAAAEVSLLQQQQLKEKGDADGLLLEGFVDAAALLEEASAAEAAELLITIIQGTSSSSINSNSSSTHSNSSSTNSSSSNSNSNSNSSSSSSSTTIRTDKILSLCTKVASALELQYQQQQLQQSSSSSSSCSSSSTDNPAAASSPSSLIKRLYFL